MHKTAEGRISTYVYMVIITLSVLMTISTITLNMTKSFGVTEIPEFQQYDAIYNDMRVKVDVLAKSQDDYEEVNNTATGGLVPRIKDHLDSTANSVVEWYDNSLIRRGFSTINTARKLAVFPVKSANTALSNTPQFSIPAPIKYMVITIITLSFVFVFVRAIWEKRT